MERTTLARIFAFIIAGLCSNAFGLQERTGLWLDTTVNGPFAKHPKWTYTLEGQVRFVDQENYYQLTNFQGGIGYNPSATLSFWIGDQWFSHNPVQDIAAGNLIWEQMVWQVYQNDLFIFRTRTRLEQISRDHEAQWLNRVREKFSFYFQNKFLSKATPLIYNEVFFKLNNTDWSNTKNFEQNRLFIGMDIPTSQITFFEIGYIQQYIFNHTGNRLNNILYIGFNIDFGRRPVSQFVH